MTQEEKAKAYDKAIDRAKKELNTCGSQDCDAARQIFRFFPELNEDEKIRETLIEFFGMSAKCNCSTCGISDKDILAWLKKQGEHANFRSKIQIGDKVTRNDSGVLVNLSQFERVAKKAEKQCKKVEPIEGFNTEFERQISQLIASIINKEHEYTEAFVKWTSDALLNYAKHEIDKQGEQKPTNKVEPKFKVDDWVVCEATPKFTAFKTGDVVQISNKETLKFFLMFKDCFRLWDVTKDAKNGDVLTTDTWTFIFKKYQDKFVYYHCATSTFNNFSISVTGVFDSNYIHPATKEQRDTFMKAMADAGYTFDFEKKELKEIEQKDPCEHCNNIKLNCANFPCIKKVAFEEGKSVYDVINKEKVDNANKTEQKSANRVEPKFKVGDYIERKDGLGCHAKIIFVGGNVYGCEKLIYPEDSSPFFELMFKNQDEFKISTDFQQKPVKWSNKDSLYYNDICEILINLLHSESPNVNKSAIQKDLDWFITFVKQTKE